MTVNFCKKTLSKCGLWIITTNIYNVYSHNNYIVLATLQWSIKVLYNRILSFLSQFLERESMPLSYNWKDDLKNITLFTQRINISPSVTLQYSFIFYDVDERNFYNYSLFFVLNQHLLLPTPYLLTTYQVIEYRIIEYNTSYVFTIILIL